jgi:V/A-type H+-transporting ATPase subunit F
MHKIAVIGDKDSILGFKAIGFDVYPVSDAEEASSALSELAGSEYAVIYVTEQTAVNISADIEKYRFSRFPAIILIPGTQGPLGIGMSSVKKSVEKAVGADILFRE